jgi:hypothetical protein
MDFPVKTGDDTQPRRLQGPDGQERHPDLRNNAEHGSWDGGACDRFINRHHEREPPGRH